MSADQYTDIKNHKRILKLGYLLIFIEWVVYNFFGEEILFQDTVYTLWSFTAIAVTLMIGYIFSMAVIKHSRRPTWTYLILIYLAAIPPLTLVIY